MNKAFSFIMALLGIHATTACSQNDFQNADVEQFAMLTSEPDIQIVDVRTAEEYAENHIEGARNIDVKSLDFLNKAQQQLDTSKRVALYCRSGKRSAMAAGQLAAKGYQVTNLLGGILAWRDAGKPVVRHTYEMDVFRTAEGKTVRFFALMHASILIDYDGLNIYIDPVKQLGDRTVDYTQLPKADFIVVTHEHQDHFDRETLKALTKTGTRLVANRRCASLNDGWGLVMNNGETQDMQYAFTIEAVPAYNTTVGHTQFHPKGRDNGYILSLDGLRIYVAGDTEDIPEMANLKDIDIAFLPCNQPYTMTPGQLLHAARMVKPRVVFPYHYGQTDVSNIPAQLQAEGMDVRIRHYE